MAAETAHIHFYSTTPMFPEPGPSHTYCRRHTHSPTQQPHQSLTGSSFSPPLLLWPSIQTFSHSFSVLLRTPLFPFSSLLSQATIRHMKSRITVLTKCALSSHLSHLSLLRQPHVNFLQLFFVSSTTQFSLCHYPQEGNQTGRRTGKQRQTTLKCSWMKPCQLQ